MSAGGGQSDLVDRPPVTRAGPLALLRAGREAFRQVPGLRWLMVQGFVLLYVLFAAVGALLMGLAYRYGVAPLDHLLAAATAGHPAVAGLLLPLVRVLGWFGEVLLLAATLLLSFVLSVSLLSVWFEALAARVAAHARGGELPEAPFRLGAWLRSLGRALADSAWLLVLAPVSLLLGFVPVAGPFLVFGLASYVMGWEVREPYLAVRTAQGEPLRALRRGGAWWTLRIGTLPVLLAMVPWLGWALLPVVLVVQVAGVAWLSERGHV